MATGLPGLFAAGEAVGGANGANRLSGNAITEALVFGRRAGRSAAERAKGLTRQGLRAQDAAAALDLVRAGTGRRSRTGTAAMVAAFAGDDVRRRRPDPHRRQAQRALARYRALAAELGALPPGQTAPFDIERLEWLDLRNMLLVAHAVAATALRRTESRGAHQREDFPQMQPDWEVNQSLRLRDGALRVDGAPDAEALAS